jgi:hypothetical protein
MGRSGNKAADADLRRVIALGCQFRGRLHFEMQFERQQHVHRLGAKDVDDVFTHAWISAGCELDHFFSLVWLLRDGKLDAGQNTGILIQ